MVYRAIPVVLPEQAFLLLVSCEREHRGYKKKGSMVEVTNYGLIGLAAILVAAFYCAYIDEAPALGTNKLLSFVTGAKMNSSRLVEARVATAQSPERGQDEVLHG
jgi:hypothetical protein